MTAAWPVWQTGGAPALKGVDDLATVARNAVVEPDHPLPLRRACEAALVRVLKRPLSIGSRRHTAILMPVPEGFHAIVDSGIWLRAKSENAGRHRLRFVLSHELGHVFFYRPGRPPSRNLPPDRAEENFCHRFATSLLVPPVAALEATLDPRGLRSLAQRYDVSLRVAAWAIARARPTVKLLWLHPAAHPARAGHAEAMRVQWGASESFVAPGESLKSPLADLAPGESGRAIERLRLAGREALVELDAWRFENSMLVIVKDHGDSALPLRPPPPQEMSRRNQLAMFS